MRDREGARGARRSRRTAAWTAVIALLLLAGMARADLVPTCPPGQRGTADAERSGTHDANRIRTVFWNYGMVGDYPPDPGRVDLSVFHSVEAPKGSGMNYSDGITPFVMGRVAQAPGDTVIIMETGFRERQGISPRYNRQMRFEPRPGFFQADPTINRGRSPAISNDPRTWPAEWPDRLADPDDPGWKGSWDGYFGKRAAATQESFTVMDDDFYDSWDYIPDARDSSRYGLGLRVEVRGFQWASPQAGNVIFWHYDITNEGTNDYDDNIIFGLYMDSGVGGSALSCDGIYESDDDNAYFDHSSGLNLVYTWDTYGHGVDLSGNCGTTGYLGYAYMETPGNQYDGQDNDSDGIIDESRDSGPGALLIGQGAIRSYVTSHYDLAKFEKFYGPLENRPAYRAGRWWTGDEDMDWTMEFHDLGADGLANTGDTGEGDGTPTAGEPYFDQTDKDESDQIGLTGFKMNRIKAGQGNPNPIVDDILFYTDSHLWPLRLWQHFTDPNPSARFDSAVAANYNIGFLFASGPFKLPAGKRERFSLALAYGQDLTELRETVRTVQLIYNANYQFAEPPIQPTLTAESGDGYVRLSWDNVAERSVDPVTNEFDFEGYRIYRSTDPEFRDPQVVATGSNRMWIPNGKPIAQFDLEDGRAGWSRKTLNGVAYYLGNDTGVTHTWTDSTVTNGQQYYYAVCAYDYGYDPGSDSLAIFPSENAIAVSRTLRGGTILPSNVVLVRPDTRVPGYVRGTAGQTAHVAGNGTGTVAVEVVNSGLLPDNHLLAVSFAGDRDSVHAVYYALRDSTAADSLRAHGRSIAGATLIARGADFAATGSGATGGGLLLNVKTADLAVPDPASGWLAGSATNARLYPTYLGALPQNQRRTGYPNDVFVRFYDTVVDTGKGWGPVPARPAKFHVFARLDNGDSLRLPFRFRDWNNDGTVDSVRVTISGSDTTYVPEFIEAMGPVENVRNDSLVTWRLELDPLGPRGRPGIVPPRDGDVYDLRIIRPLNDSDLFAFTTGAEHLDPARAAVEAKERRPYVVPNPYVGSASFEAARYADSGRGERRIEFRDLPFGATVRIYTVRGDLVRTLRQGGSLDGMVPWDLRTKDNLDAAPGLYLFHVEAPGTDEFTGKFAVIK